VFVDDVEFIESGNLNIHGGHFESEGSGLRGNVTIKNLISAVGRKAKHRGALIHNFGTPFPHLRSRKARFVGDWGAND
jgi:hypothetical protein